jgi:hypothetical protein
MDVGLLSKFLRFPQKLAGQWRLLARDPEAFGRNLRQITDPAGFIDALIDVPDLKPLQLSVSESLPPAFNIVLAKIAPGEMTGGPNTALNLAAHLAASGVQVRLISADIPIAGDRSWFASHLAKLSGLPDSATQIHLAGSDEICRIGADDMFVATYWTTAHQVAAALPRLRKKEFFYLIQDFEPGFYPWSNRYAMALQTYAMPIKPVINEATLAAHFFDGGIGRFGADLRRESCLIFAPALDRALFHPQAENAAREGPKKLLFYARPSNPRNLFGLGLAALRQAVAEGVFAGDWAFWAIGAGGALPELDLGQGHRLRLAPWRDYQDYAASLRQADILLCPMLSPHTSYPALEMAASGGLAVTNAFSAKTAEKLAAISPNIVAVEASIAGFAAGLRKAVARVAVPRDGAMSLPRDWAEAFAAIVPAMVEILLDTTV